MNKRDCPCGSGHSYAICCEPYHKGKIVPSAVALLRARFSAYALNLPHFIKETTHKDNSEYVSNFLQWKKKIADFSSSYSFEKVEILKVENKQEETSIRFIARLKKGTTSASFIEKSYFVKSEGRWLYREGTIEEGR